MRIAPRVLACAALSCALALSLPLAATAGPKALFDNTKAETAGNADWIISVQQPIPGPSPQSGITWATPETYWVGAASAWGVQLVKRGYTVATLTTTYGITYGNVGNPYDLSNYDLFILTEPNIKFSAAESTAVFNFVRDGGGLIAVSDHYGSDRNNDGFDSVQILNLLDPQHLLGVHIAGNGELNNNIVQTSTNVSTAPGDSIIHGGAGFAQALAYHNGSTMTLYPGVNPTVRGNVWMTGLPQSSLTGVMAAQSVYGNGRVFFACDSSPVDDGTGQSGNSLFTGWAESADSLIFLNATLWATRRTGPAPDGTPPLVTVLAPNGGESWKAGSTHAVTWNATDAVGVTAVDLAYSTDGGATWPGVIATGIANTGTYTWTVPNLPSSTLRVRATARDAALNAGVDASDGNFAVDLWTISASAGPGGTIAPAGAVGVPQGATPSFTLTPLAGFAVVDLALDGGSLGALAGYTFAPVSADHALVGAFADVAAPTVQITAPVGGEQWAKGSAQLVTWSAADNAGVTAVDLDLSLHGADGPWSEIAHGLANAGSYAWTTPDSASDSALVRVTAFDAASHATAATSDSVFALFDPLVAAGAAPATLSLSAPFPSPGRGAVTLRYALPARGVVRLEIVDLAGRLVWSEQGERAAGTHAAGLYFVRLVTPWGARTGRVLRLD